MPRLDDQITFLLSCDRLKGVERTTFLHDGSRPENSAEHSWHLALMALTLGEYAPPGTDLGQVVRLLLVHDLVEIHAGDTFFDVTGAQLAQQSENERRAAQALFGLLPAPQGEQFQTLWEEFEAAQTPEARFARALDALHPMLLTWGEGAPGCADRHPDLNRERVLRLKEPRLGEFPALWALAQEMLQEAQKTGLLPPEQETASLPVGKLTAEPNA